MSGRWRTREESRQARRECWFRLLLTGLFLAAVLLLLGLDTAPPPGTEVRECMARVAATQEYDRVVALYGDRETAELCAQTVYQEVISHAGE